MSKKIAIIGHGIVGKSVERLFQNHYSLVIYDPAETNIYPKKEIDSCDLVIICVPTNPNPDGSCDTSIVEKTISKLKTSLILIKSTIAPGTTDRLSKQTKKHICFSPEYIGESKYYHPYWVEMIETPFLIIGGESQDCEKIINFFEPVMGPTKTYFKCRAIEAEIIKYMENSFFATKVTFVNEFLAFVRVSRQIGTQFERVGY